MSSSTDPGSTSPGCQALWDALRGPSSALRHLSTGGPPALSSRFDVSGLATDSTGLASLAVAEFHSLGGEQNFPEVTATSVEASAAFCCESLQAPIGWKLPPVWDPVAGNYRARDRWIRLHTNYAAHRQAVLSVLGVAGERDAVASAVETWDAAALEQAVVEAGGAAAVMYEREAWLSHDAGRATQGEPAVALLDQGACAEFLPQTHRDASPLAGIRVLDLTRVIAGPLCTRFLAAYGADVLRVDPPGFEEVGALLPETTIGKRRCFLDLHESSGRARFLELIAEADVLVVGLRPGALLRLGLDAQALQALNPSLILAELDAYGWSGPWRERRGFDSLVQMSCGIAAEVGAPAPLPAQALDHATGYLLAAGVCRGLSLRTAGHLVSVRASLLGTANHLWTRPLAEPTPAPKEWPAELFETADTAWGPVRRVGCPGRIVGVRANWQLQAGPLGVDEARFAPR